MELQQLKYFRAVAEEQSFTRAAKRLFVTQPNVSIQIRKLEQELGTQLFNRAHGAVTLSPAGELLDDCAQSVLSALEDTTARIRTLEREPAPPLRIGYVPSLGSTVVPAIVVHIRKAAPEIPLAFEEIADSTLIQEMLADGRLDVGVGRLPGARARVLFSEDFVVACPARGPLRKRNFGDARAFALTPFVIPSEGIGLRTQILDICRSIGFDPHVVLEAQSLDLLLGAVACGVGVSVLPRLCLDMKAGTAAVPLDHRPAARTISLAWRRQADVFHRHPQLARCLASCEAGPEEVELMAG
ncbi:LysR family transcriptional regulator [Amycolatopsis acidiphila]|uniref:LysR family transcriptional regulator n=1 Tax=Amycolatopsis acidiphila TaxID=715473 RepID=A0A558AP25_9PSEU|nr:LysR family transcriptional regulator [Amycolatopsis acidiphila]TVT25998.1 LysR family transcriptional regulator [Amycolatopsis acidiphila]UIJ63287.1 LysR family transcriptional regulator [Amycolatopsis acidiphila]GHG74806.1 LysR family transcriptional regulator [Amycolatopsis acidiphila]